MDVYSGDFLNKKNLIDVGSMTIGNFDGVHRGHQYLINQLKKMDSPSLVLSFSPHPRQILGKTPVEKLFSEADRKEQLQNCGIEIFAIQDFTATFAALSGEDFLRQYVFSVFNPKSLLLGHDFSFGRGGVGNFDLVREIASERGCALKQSEPFLIKDKVVSSSEIRSLLKEGDVLGAESYLGRNYYIEGEVTRGEGLGRQLGFPTANMTDIRTLIPLRGVYAGVAHIDGRINPAVLNIGVRPTVSSSNTVSVECHLMDFKDDLYGKKIRFSFVDRIRGEQKFSGKLELIDQISKDKEVAMKIIKGSSFFE